MSLREASTGDSLKTASSIHGNSKADRSTAELDNHDLADEI